MKSQFNFKQGLNTLLVGIGAFLCLTASVKSVTISTADRQPELTSCTSIDKRGQPAYTRFRVQPGNEYSAECEVKPTILIAQQSRTQRLQFKPGKDSVTVENSVVRGTRDTYLLRARSRQKMTVSISSLEKNAVFDILAPNKKLLKQEVTSWSGVLPSTGDYQVVVGGTRGNASYKLQVTVK